MQAKEKTARIAAIQRLYAGLARRVSDETIAAVVSATATVPVRWLEEAAYELVGSWDHGSRPPGPREVYATAARRAGFRAAYSAWGGFTDPTPELVRWWPQHPHRVTGERAEQFALGPPPQNELPTLRVPRSRLALAASGTRELALLTERA